jgi:hypothetical protein
MKFGSQLIKGLSDLSGIGGNQISARPFKGVMGRPVFSGAPVVSLLAGKGRSDEHD